MSARLTSCNGEDVRPHEVVDDPSDPRLADYIDLTDPVLRRRIESERRFFIAESPLVVRRLLVSDRHVRSVLVTPERYDLLADVVEGRPDVRVYVAPEDVLRRVVGFRLHRGVVAAADRWPLPPAREVLRGARRVAVLQQVNDHENLGVLFRSAAALGIDAVLLDDQCSDPLYRRCVRVSIGHVLALPWTRVATLDDVAASGFTSYALTPDPAAASITSVRWAERAALLLGAEGPGLSDAWLDQADERVRIPMQPGADSLNVATAAAIAFYESSTTRPADPS
jgi:tRNA G18 (ribose-2'-O)-methylase SpoU